MHYCIDDVKNTAVRADGKAIYGWNHESRAFDLPVANATPKSRMTRCSFFEARRYLFEQDPRDCYERIMAVADKAKGRSLIADVSAITMSSAEAALRAAEERNEELLPEIQAMRAAVEEYGMEMSDAGQCLSNCIRILEADIEIARKDIEIARYKAEMEKCEKGQCGECPYVQDCDNKKETKGKV